jgi:aminocarboxymuconate-semialdehyde decarboxylase
MTLHTCSPSAATVRAPEGRVVGGLAGRTRHFTVDFHCHVLALAAEGLVADRPEKQAEAARMVDAIGAESVAHNNAVMLPNAFPKLTQVEQRLADMEASGVDLQVISPSPSQYYYWADRGLAQQLVRTLNEHVAETCTRHPDRFVGLGTVALQHSDLAAEQLTDAMKRLGLKGVEISTAVNDLELDAPQMTPFWAAAEELGAIVFIHPFGTTLGKRVSANYLSNIIGQPLETTLALSHLIFGGVLDRHPGLKIVAAHGGGYLPSYCGRSNHGHEVRPEARTTARQAPIDYLRKIWFDTLVYEPQALRHLVEVVGASQLVVGSDYPFDMGHYDPHGLLAATAGLTDTQRQAILGANALALLGMNLPPTAGSSPT